MGKADCEEKTTDLPDIFIPRIIPIQSLVQIISFPSKKIKNVYPQDYIAES